MALNLDRQALREELDADPEGLGYASMTDEEVAAALNKQRAVGTEEGTVTYTEVLERAPKAKLLSIEKANRDGSSANAVLFMELLRYGGGVATGKDTRGRDVIEGLVSDGLLSAAEAAAFVGWGVQEVTRSRARELWGDTVITAEDVAEARALKDVG